MTIISKEEYENPPDTLHATDVSVIGLNPLGMHVHASRLSMHVSQSGQMNPLCNSERPMIYHGITEFPDLALNTTVPRDCIVLKKVTSGDKSERMTLVCQATGEESSIFIISIPLWVGSHTKFGFIPVRTELLNDITGGETLLKDQILTHPPTVDGMYFNSGVHLNTLVASFPGTSEDGVILRDGAREKLAYDVVHTIVFNLTDNQILVNRYGNDHVHLGLPEVGSKVPRDNVVCAIRDIAGRGVAGSLTEKSRSEIQHNDILIQSTDIAGAEIIDIEVVTNLYNEDHLYGPHCHQLNSLSDISDKHRRAIRKATEHAKYDAKRKGYTLLEDPDLSNLLIHDQVTLESRRSTRRVKLQFKTADAPPYQITIKILKKGVKPERGGKIVDRSSAKSTITSIWPDWMMPPGVDIIVAKEAGINRAIPARDIEQYINTGAVNASDALRELLKYHRVSKDHIVDSKRWLKGLSELDLRDRSYNVSKESIVEKLLSDKATFTACLGVMEVWSDITNHLVKDVLLEFKDQHPREVARVIANAVIHNIVTPLPTDYLSKHGAVDMCRKLELSPFAPRLKLLTYKNEMGQDVELKYPMLVGPIYYSVLDKDATEISASSGQTRQAMGLPAVRSYKDKFISPLSRLPVKTIGLDELQIFTGALGGADKVAHGFLEFFDRIISTDTQVAEIEAMLNSDTPTGLKTLVDRNKVPYGNGRALQIINHMLKVHGSVFTSI